MSGGVNSSVVAALLKQQGHEVIGVTLQLYDHGEAVGRRGSCCAGQDIHDARRVADRLGIAHYVLDYEQRFKATVMQSFADSYAAGETPIPCVVCNQQIKFHELLATARELGGGRARHRPLYRAAPGPCRPRAVPRPRCRARPELLSVRHHARAARLAALSPRRLSPRPRCARWRASFALPVADKSDSQDICFVPQGRYTSVIERLKPGAAESGDIVHVDGRRARPARRHHQLHDRPAPRSRRRRAPRRSTSSASMPPPGRSWWDRATACMRTGSPLGTSTGSATSRFAHGGNVRCRARAIDVGAAAGDLVPVG